MFNANDAVSAGVVIVQELRETLCQFRGLMCSLELCWVLEHRFEDFRTSDETLKQESLISCGDNVIIVTDCVGS